MSEDLRRAREILEQSGYTCVLCRQDQVKTCTARGVRPLVELLDAGQWSGYSAADKVIGKATAFLYALLGVRAVYTPVISESAVRILHRYRIELVCGLENMTWEQLAQNIAVVLPKYDIGGVNESIGLKSNSTTINALRAFYDFCKQ